VEVIGPSRSVRFTPSERSPVAHWIGGWVGSRACLDAVAKRKNSIIAPCQESNPGRATPSAGKSVIYLQST